MIKGDEFTLIHHAKNSPLKIKTGKMIFKTFRSPNW